MMALPMAHLKSAFAADVLTCSIYSNESSASCYISHCRDYIVIEW